MGAHSVDDRHVGRDPAIASPDHYRVLQRTPWGRLLLASWPAGSADRPHSHPTGIWFALTEMQLERSEPGEQTLRRKIEAGDSGVQPPVARHSVKNLGSSPARVLMLETEPSQPRSPAPPNRSAPRSILTGNLFRLLEEHAGYRLVLATFEPGVRTQPHSHPATIWYALTDVQVRLKGPRAAAKEISLTRNQHRLFAPVAAHSVENLGSRTARVLLFESP